jgi:hypothetical protein
VIDDVVRENGRERLEICGSKRLVFAAKKLLVRVQLVFQSVDALEVQGLANPWGDPFQVRRLEVDSTDFLGVRVFPVDVPEADAVSLADERSDNPERGHHRARSRPSASRIRS